MQYLGFFLIVVAIVGIIYGILQQMKAKKILAAPFKKTAEVASNPQAADAKGLISCEGAIQTQQPVMAPCSGRPAVYVEIEVVRLWEKYVQTENGMKTEKGKDTVSTAKQGSHFYLNDGSGPCGVDARESVDCDLEQTFEQVQNVSSGDVIFGQFRTHVPYDGSDKRTTGIRATEKIVAAQGNLFVMGKLAAGTVTKTDGLLGKLLASTKGREKLVGSTKRNALIGFIAGGLMFAGGVPLSIFGDPPVDHCAHLADAAGDVCGGHI
ncbi:MAG: GIDE domain-containing protein, partial [Minicystis sp.]